jgi:hypothetical protein
MKSGGGPRPPPDPLHGGIPMSTRHHDFPPPASPTLHPHAELQRVAAAFPDLPLEAICKEDLLRRGVAFSPAALERSARHKPKAYFIFSFDMVPLEAMEGEEHRRAPEEITLVGGPHGFRRTVVSVRLNPASPYRVDVEDDRLRLRLGGAWVADVMLAPCPAAYRQTLPNGKLMSEVAPTIEWGYLVYLTVFRQCQYFGGEEECHFCDINENFRQQVRAGRPYQTVKSVEDVVAALEVLAAAEDRSGVEFGDTPPAPAAGARPADPDTQPLLRSHAYTLTGGSVTSKLRGLGEIEFYCRYAEAIEARFPGRWISKLVVQAHEPDQVRRIRDAGVRIYHPNYEVWDERLFRLLCPGKARWIGRDTWVRRILAAAEVLGPAHVIPNFVAGIEVSRPHGFASVEEALRSTGEGLDFFMSHGVVPRFTTWCPEPLSVLGRDQGPAPLDYHAGLLRLWRDTHRKHGLPVPLGYGDPGPGRAVFSVSAFMDVLETPRSGAAM